MQNKNNFLETIFCNPSPRYYRSIRYISNRSLTIPSKDNARHNQVLQTQHSFENYTKIKRINLSLCTKGNSRKAITLENEQENAHSNRQKISNDTWNTMMNPADFIKKLDNKLQI